MMRKTLSMMALAALIAGGTACSASDNSDGGNHNGGDTGGNHNGDDGSTTEMDSGFNDRDVQAIEIHTHDVAPNPDAFFANDPPPMICYADGGRTTTDVPIGGTPECPDDKNREGCPCPVDMVGQMAPCWPGLRANRGRGACHDGVTTCMELDELSGVWGPCQNYVLPTPGAHGAAACQCFSAGRWNLDNLSPCFVMYGSQYYAVSTYIGADHQAHCPDTLPNTPPPQPQPGTNFTTDQLTVDCTGQFRLCYTLKAGNAMSPTASDCTVAQVCTTAWYMTAGTAQSFPPLPSWTTSDAACATRFATTGGYGEMSVRGLSGECENVDDGSGNPYVFQRVNYCPLACSQPNPPAMCAMCSNGGSGNF